MILTDSPFSVPDIFQDGASVFLLQTDTVTLPCDSFYRGFACKYIKTHVAEICRRKKNYPGDIVTTYFIKI